jgi:hypothetical protein
LSDQIEQFSLGTGANLTNTAITLGFVPNACNNQKIQWMLCPSSPLPQQELLQTSKSNCVVPSYVGISGATLHGGALSNVYVAGETAFQETRTKPNTLASTSTQAWGGMLCPNETYGIAACLDGTSNTIVVSEKSDYFYSQDSVQASRTRQRIDGSYYNGGSGGATGGWWFIGMPTQPLSPGVTTAANAGYNSSFGPNTWNMALNITTLRSFTSPAPTNAMIGFNGRGINLNLSGNTITQGMGICQQNNPLVSAHPNVVLAVYMDGHTQGLTKNTPAAIGKRLATRDDGQQIADY